MVQSITLKHAFLIDGTGGEPIEDAAVVVTRDRITEIHPHSQGIRASAGRTIDLKGKTLMPGLIDAHVHPGNVEWSLSQTVDMPPAVYVHRVTRTLETDLQLGFTTLRDAAGLDPGFRSAIDQGLVLGPRLLLSVSPLISRGASAVPEPRNSLGIAPEICCGIKQMRQAVERTLARGADQIKIFADGEVVSQSSQDMSRPGQSKFSIPELAAAVKSAESAGTYVMAHVYGSEATRNCVQAGIRSIEHGNLMDEKTARRMARKGIYFVPTLTIYDLLLGMEGRFLDKFSRQKLASVGRKGLQVLEWAHRAGVKIGSGSDIIGPLQHLKGRELAIKAGVMGPMAAIVSATKTNAELMGLSDRIGTLEPGKIADLIVLSANPLDDMGLFERGLKEVLLVMQAGEVVKDHL